MYQLHLHVSLKSHIVTCDSVLCYYETVSVNCYIVLVIKSVPRKSIGSFYITYMFVNTNGFTDLVMPSINCSVVCAQQYRAAGQSVITSCFTT